MGRRCQFASGREHSHIPCLRPPKAAVCQFCHLRHDRRRERVDDAWRDAFNRLLVPHGVDLFHDFIQEGEVALANVVVPPPLVLEAVLCQARLQPASFHTAKSFCTTLAPARLDGCALGIHQPP